MLKENEIYTLPARQVWLCGRCVAIKHPTRAITGIYVDDGWVVGTDSHLMTICPLSEAIWNFEGDINIPNKTILKFERKFVLKCKNSPGTVVISDYDPYERKATASIVGGKREVKSEPVYVVDAHYPDWRRVFVFGDREFEYPKHSEFVNGSNLKILGDSGETLTYIGQAGHLNMYACSNPDWGKTPDVPYWYTVLTEVRRTSSTGLDGKTLHSLHRKYTEDMLEGLSKDVKKSMGIDENTDG